MFKYLLLFLSMNILCNAQEIYDVETLPTHRTKQYTLESFEKIVIFSAPRTGSSLVYNVFRFLFEKDSKLLSSHAEFDLDRLVLKTHLSNDMDLLIGENVLCIFTLRDPIEAAISHHRISIWEISNMKDFAKDVVDRQLNCLLYSESLEQRGKSVLRLKYENFVDNVEFLLNEIEKQLQISIDPKDKELMRRGYSKENVRLCTRHLVDFSEDLPISGFHGKHVKIGKYTAPKSFIHWLYFYMRDIKYLFKPYGYF